MDSNRFIGRIFKYITKLKMTNAWINETENDIEELHITYEDIKERIQLRNMLHNLKVSRKTPERKHEPFGLRKGERNTRKE